MLLFLGVFIIYLIRFAVGQFGSQVYYLGTNFKGDRILGNYLLNVILIFLIRKQLWEEGLLLILLGYIKFQAFYYRQNVLVEYFYLLVKILYINKSVLLCYLIKLFCYFLKIQIYSLNLSIIVLLMIRNKNLCIMDTFL